MTKSTKSGDKATRRQAWQPMEVRELGELSEVIRTGGGKLSSAGGDPGENRKQMGGGG